VEAADELDRLLRDAVALRMIADVDVGALLSGGVDSATVVAIMQDLSARPVRTFTIGFGEERFNEAPHARALGKHLGTDHTELRVTPEDALRVVPMLPEIYDEPFADFSQIPTFLVCRLARKRVTVALSGDGGDETFAGYNRYFEAAALWKKRSRYPRVLRSTAATVLRQFSTACWRAMAPAPGMPLGRMPRWRMSPAGLDRLARGLGAQDQVQLSQELHLLCPQGDAFLEGAASSRVSPLPWAVDGLQSGWLQMMAADYAGYLHGDVLTKVDRASMAVSLEVRCPILDHRVTEFAWRLPDTCRVDRVGGKRVLRHVLSKYVPPNLTDRPKRGFGVPVGEWLRGSLREWAEELLDPVRLRAEGLLSAAAVREVWAQHLCGWRKHSRLLWSLLMFRAWQEYWDR